MDWTTPDSRTSEGQRGVLSTALGAGRWLLVAAALAGLASCGGQQPTKPSTGGVQASERASTQPLPDWAPENPSPEFLRAAKVLKPLPPEWVEKAAQRKAVPPAFMMSVLSKMSLPAYEFFGTLTDEQIQRFLDTGLIRLPMDSLSPRQREAWDRFIAGRDEATEGDTRVWLFKLGAKEDLSNVDVGFTRDGQAVSIAWWVRNLDDPGEEGHGREFFGTL